VQRETSEDPRLTHSELGLAGVAGRMSKALALDLSAKRVALLACIGLFGAGVALMPMSGVTEGAMTGLAIVIVTVALMATSALPGLVTALIFFALALATQTAPAMAVLSSFWANATMLIFGGLIIGAAAERSGLGRYVARGLMQKFLGSYFKLLAGVLIGTFGLSFLLPSTMGRLAITIPIVTAICKEVGYEPGSNGYAAMVLTAVAGNFTTSYAILPANLTNVITIGAAESLFGPQLGYIEYLVCCAPVLGALKGATFLALLLMLFPAPAPLQQPPAAPLPLSRAARRLAVVLGATVALWASDVLHGLKPGWIAMGAAVLCLLPPLGLVRLRECFDVNRLSAVIIVPAVQGIATVLTHSGAGGLIAALISTVIPLHGLSQTLGFVVIAVTSALVATVATVVGAIAIVTPMLGEVQAATGLPTKAGLLAQITGLQAPLLHYVATPIMVGIAMGGVSPRMAARMLVPLAVSGLVIVLPAMIGWLRLIGVMQ